MDECLEVAVEVNSGHVLIKEVVKKDGGYLVYTLIIAAARCAMSPCIQGNPPIIVSISIK